MKIWKAFLIFTMVAFITVNASYFGEKYAEHQSAVRAATLDMVTDTMEGMSFFEIEKKAIQTSLVIICFLILAFWLTFGRNEADDWPTVRRNRKIKKIKGGMIDNAELIQVLIQKKTCHR